MNIEALKELTNARHALGPSTNENLKARRTLFETEALETEGVYQVGLGKTVIDLHRIRATGTTETDAQQIWMRAAYSHIDRNTKADA